MTLTPVASVDRCFISSQKCRENWNSRRSWQQLDRYRIDFVEQPVLQDPITSMQEVQNRSQVALCANEGLWTTEDAYLRIKNRVADVFCFSPYWVTHGSL